jgi:hypothetical protein
MKWSYRITFLYLGFVGLIGTLVFISNNNKEELVSKDYYAKELAFQQRINSENNERSLKETMEHHVDEATIMLQLPESMIGKEVTGSIAFYCPSSSKKDKSFPMQFNSEGRMYLEKNKLEKGAYKMQLDWKCEGKEYYKEEVITLK